MTYPILSDNVDVQKNYSGMFRIVRSLVLVTLLVFSIFFFRQVNAGILVICFFLLWFILDRYGRNLLPDWRPNKNNNHMILDTDLITVRLNQEETKFRVHDLKGIIIFLDHYRGYSSSHRDLIRNGNALMFLNFINGPSRIVKFNIPGKEHLDELNRMTKEYAQQVEYYKDYSTNMIGTILTKDMTKPKYL